MNSQEVILTSTGVYHPPLSISNDELVASYNAWAKRRNERLAEQIAPGPQATPKRQTGIKRAAAKRGERMMRGPRAASRRLRA